MNSSHITEDDKACSERAITGAVGIVASAGGIDAVIRVLRPLSRTYPAPIFLAQHLARSMTSKFPRILQGRCGAEVDWAVDGATPQLGHVYVVPPGAQLELEHQRICLRNFGPSPRDWLPSPDVMLQSLCRAYGSRTVGIVLSGMLPVGILGLRAINAVGGFTIAQHRATAQHLDMPSAAADVAKAHMVLNPANIALALDAIAASWAAPASRSAV